MQMQSFDLKHASGNPDTANPRTFARVRLSTAATAHSQQQ
jgi:hypothetical protein